MKVCKFLIMIMFSSWHQLSLSNISTIHEDPNVKKQVNGDFNQMERKESLPLGAIQTAWDNSTAGQGIYDVEYLSNEVIKLRVREYMTTTIELPKWEIIKKVVIGDDGVVKATVLHDRFVVLKPQEYIGADTSVTVICHGYTYWFYVRCEGYNSKLVPDIGVKIRAFPPLKNKVEGISNKNEQKTIDYLEKVVTSPEELNFKFSMSGSKKIAPKIVYSDGYRTWLNYGENIKKVRLPVIYIVVDGVDTPVNVTKIKQSLVIQGSGTFTLKNGEEITCVYPTKQKK